MNTADTQAHHLGQLADACEGIRRQLARLADAQEAANRLHARAADLAEKNSNRSLELAEQLAEQLADETRGL